MGDNVFLRREPKPQNVIVVAKNGNFYGSGSYSKQCITLEQALSKVTNSSYSNPWKILLAPGTYTENNPSLGIDLPEGVSFATISGPGTVTIVAQNPGNPLFRPNLGTHLDGLIYGGAYLSSAFNCDRVTNFILSNSAFFLCKYGIYSNNSSGRIVMNDFKFVEYPSFTTTAVIHNLAGDISCTGCEIAPGSTLEYAFYANGSTAQIDMSGFMCDSSSVQNVFYANNGGYITSFSGSIANTSIAFHIGPDGSNSTIKASAIDLPSGTDTDLKIESNTGVFIGTGVNLNRDKLEVINIDNVHTFGYDSSSQVSREIGNMAVGMNGHGSSIMVGEGGPYTNGMKVLSYNGSTYTDVTSDATITFPGVTAGNALYFGDTNSYNFYGVNYLMGATPINLGTGSLIWEYYDGGTLSWLPFKVMVTYCKYSDTFLNAAFAGTNNNWYAIKFDKHIRTGIFRESSSSTGWAAASVNGITGKWIRCRIATAITTAPVIQNRMLMGNYLMTRFNGTMMYSGEARVSKRVLLHRNPGDNLENQTINFSTNINTATFNDNRFRTGQDRSSYFTFIVPTDMDTSCGIRIYMDVYGELTTASSAINFDFYMAQTSGTNVRINGTLPEQTYLHTMTLTNYTSYNMIPFLCPWEFYTDTLKPGDLVAIRIRRNAGADPYNADVILIDTQLEYIAWQNGTKYL